MTELFYKKSRKNRIDLKGKRFGRLTVLEYAGTGKSGTFWKCKCDCGKITTVLSHSLRSGRTTSCGCYNREVTSKRNRNILKQVERLQEQLDKAKKALCEASRMSLSDETDISKIYDIVHPVIVYLNGGVK